MEQPTGGPTGHLDPSKIYPDVTHDASIQHDYSHQGGVVMDKANAELKMSGLSVGPRVMRSKQLDILGAIIVLSGGFSLYSNHSGLVGVIFNAAYVLVGLGIIGRYELARKVVIGTSILGLVFNVLELIGVSALSSGKRSFMLQLSILFSIAVEITALSILTWHKNEEEFR